MMSLLLEAMSRYGLAEIPGPAENRDIVAMSKALGYPFKSEDDNWCGIFMAYCALQTGLQPPEKAYTARNWLKWGYEPTAPETGDIVVFWRVAPDSWQGHVGIFINFADPRREFINVLGGNQGNRVCIAPYETSRVLGYRRTR